MEAYINALEERAALYKAEADWESLGRSSYCRGKADAILDIVAELRVLTSEKE